MQKVLPGQYRIFSQFPKQLLGSLSKRDEARLLASDGRLHGVDLPLALLRDGPWQMVAENCRLCRGAADEWAFEMCLLEAFVFEGVPENADVALVGMATGEDARAGGEWDGDGLGVPDEAAHGAGCGDAPIVGFVADEAGD